MVKLCTVLIQYHLRKVELFRSSVGTNRLSNIFPTAGLKIQFYSAKNIEINDNQFDVSFKFLKSNVPKTVSMKCTALLFPSRIEMWEFQKISKTSTVYVNESELILKGLFEENDIELACLAFRATFLESVVDA